MRFRDVNRRELGALSEFGVNYRESTPQSNAVVETLIFRAQSIPPTLKTDGRPPMINRHGSARRTVRSYIFTF
jgi:hypothetical protein